MAGCLSVRDIMWYLVFTGFAMNYMFRLNINIGIVSMVKNRQTKTAHSSVCNQESLSSHFINDTNITTMTTQESQESRFDWDEKQQGIILASFFWCFCITQVPGGMLAQRYGTKLIYGLSNFIPCLLSFLIPFCARLDYRVLAILRGLQGFVAGASWPAMHHLASNWIPPNERSKFVTAYMGSSVGAAITYPLCGLLIDWFDWPAVFHVTGILGVIWFIAWWLLIYDSPEKHPRISEKEKLLIMQKLGESYSEKQFKTPWKKILLSTPLWMNILAQWGNIWGLFTLMTQAPTYFKLIHGWDIRMTGFLSGMPHLARVSFAILISFIGDFILKKNYMSRTNVRKMAAAWCCIGQGVFTLGLVFCGCNSSVAIIFSTIATGVSGAVSTGPLASIIDISPNFASIMLGISNMVTVVPGFVSPVIVGYLTYENQTVEAWKSVFIISTVMLVVSGVLYLFFSSSELQEWNTPSDYKQNPDIDKLKSLVQEEQKNNVEDVELNCVK